MALRRQPACLRSARPDQDRWGLSWQIVPWRLGELMMDPDRAKAGRVAEAMLKMVRFDIAPLEAAAMGQ